MPAEPSKSAAAGKTASMPEQPRSVPAPEVQAQRKVLAQAAVPARRFLAVERCRRGIVLRRFFRSPHWLGSLLYFRAIRPDMLLSFFALPSFEPAELVEPLLLEWEWRSPT